MVPNFPAIGSRGVPPVPPTSLMSGDHSSFNEFQKLVEFINPCRMWLNEKRVLYQPFLQMLGRKFPSIQNIPSVYYSI